jgi:hypothetical protein
LHEDLFDHPVLHSLIHSLMFVFLLYKHTEHQNK